MPSMLLRVRTPVVQRRPPCPSLALTFVRGAATAPDSVDNFTRCLAVVIVLDGAQSSAEVYKGMMKVQKDGEPQAVAIKRMSPQALQGLQNFQREVDTVVFLS